MIKKHSAVKFVPTLLQNYVLVKKLANIIKYVSPNTSCFIVCEATCFGPYMTIIKPICESIKLNQINKSWR